MNINTLESRIATIREAAQQAPVVLFEGRVRWWIQRNHDGFADRCVIRRGGRIFLDLDAVEKWLDAGRVTAPDKVDQPLIGTSSSK